ncbi:hypothetical protein TIFTF001_031837 [Ficus carica]|uniref:CCT domain-containing protein n=1 Tax=Ficus carica TaxID=3494 RepID=A0AA88DW01_FICCA|nr:hypothetical protein TIFTF001_031837 [Ficus carica]
MLLPRNHHLQMSSCLSGGGGGVGGGRAYAFELEILKSPSSSPSSTLSESSNSGLVITTRKPRTPRKRPNQTYNEAAALLSTAYPNLFSPAATAAAANNSRTFSKSPYFSTSSDDSSELFFPFRLVDDDSTLLISEKNRTVRTTVDWPKFSGNTTTNSSNSSSTLSEKSCPSPGEFDSRAVDFHRPSSMDLDFDDSAEEFDYHAAAAEEVDDGGGIDSIMGNLTVESSSSTDRTAANSAASNTCYGYPMGLGLGFELGFGIRRGGFVRALRHADDGSYGNSGNWWNFPAVDMVELSPRFRKQTEKKKKKKMKKVVAVVEREKAAAMAAAAEENAGSGDGAGGNKSLELPKTGNVGLGTLLLKLNYDGVLKAWSDKGSPFSDEGDAPTGNRNDVAARLAQIDLFPETGGVREASVLRYKEKRRTRLFSKKIRYQVRKVNADRRPRMKGRFVRRLNSKHE